MNRRCFLAALPGLAVAPKLLEAIPAPVTAPFVMPLWFDTEGNAVDAEGRRFGCDKPVSRVDMVHEYVSDEHRRIDVALKLNAIYGKSYNGGRVELFPMVRGETPRRRL